VTSSSLQEIASLEAERAVRSGRWFSLLRLAPSGWLALDVRVGMLEALVRAYLRRTDGVCRVRDYEIGVVLVETTGRKVLAPLARLKKAIARELPELDVWIGWAPVGPEQQLRWEEAWRWAGQLLVADAAVPAAA